MIAVCLREQDRQRKVQNCGDCAVNGHTFQMAGRVKQAASDQESGQHQPPQRHPDNYRKWRHRRRARPESNDLATKDRQYADNRNRTKKTEFEIRTQSLADPGIIALRKRFRVRRPERWICQCLQARCHGEEAEGDSVRGDLRGREKMRDHHIVRLPVDHPADADHEKFPAVRKKILHEIRVDTSKFRTQPRFVKTEQPDGASNVRGQSESETTEYEPRKSTSKPNYSEERREIAETSCNIPKARAITNCESARP